MRNLDLLVLLSFTVSLYFFNQGDVFTAMPLAYPPLLYLLGRMAWIGWKGRGSPSRPLWPVWVLLAATVFLAGFRFGMNVARRTSSTSARGRDRRAADRPRTARCPTATCPTTRGGVRRGRRRRLRAGADPDERPLRGRQRPRATRTARSATSAYVPGFLAHGLDCKWDFLPAAHFTSLLWDALALARASAPSASASAGRGSGRPWRSRGRPTRSRSTSRARTRTTRSCRRFLIWGLLRHLGACARPLRRRSPRWTKFAAFLLFPLWASYPDGRRASPRQQLLFLGGFLLATALGFWILLLEPDPLHAARVFWDRTFGWQLSRPSPFSIWDWERVPRLPGPARPPDGAEGPAPRRRPSSLYFVPRTKNVIQLAALSGALLIGFELVLTHWFYLYIPWFFPFVAFALLVARGGQRGAVAEPAPRGFER